MSHEPTCESTGRQRTNTPPPNNGSMANTSMGTRQQTEGGMGSRQATTWDDAMLAEHEKLSRPLYTEVPEPLTNSEKEANPLSKLFLQFLNGTMAKALELDENMEVEHLDPMIGNDRAEKGFDNFRVMWEAELKANPKDPNLLKVIFQCCRFYVLCNIFWIILECAAPFTSVVLMKYVNEFVTNKSDPMWKGGVLAVSFFVSTVLTTVGTAQSFRILCRLSIRITSMIQMEMMRKTIQLSSTGMKQVGQGMLFQVFNGDANRCGQMLPFVFRSFDCVLQVIGAFIYLGVIVGWPTCGAVVVFLCVLPFNYRISDSFIGLFINKMIAGDKRTKKVIEIINNARVVKFFGWEGPFVKLIERLREPELKMISQLMKQLAFLMCSFGFATPLMQIVLFILITVKEGHFGVLTFFQALSLTNILGLAMVRLPFVYSQILQTQISMARIKTILVADEVPEGHQTMEVADNVGDVIIENAAFSFDAPSIASGADEAHSGAALNTTASTKHLDRFTFRAKKGELVMVVGKVGGGKSALVSALLGEMTRLNDNSSEGASVFKRKGTVAYVPQTAWILNATVRNNIVVDKPFDRTWYDRVIDAVDLRVDLAALPNGDLTEVGEKGINLSGGQRQRVSLARALYSQADIYIFDDPLSALDAAVGRHVFTDGISGLLAEKTRILVTHQMSYLSQATRVYVCQDMKVTEEALPKDIPSEATEGESTLVTMLRAWNETSTTTHSPGHAASPKANEEGAKKKEKKADTSGKLTVREERVSGKVAASTLLLYLKSFGGVGFWVPLLLMHTLVASCNIFGQLWMGFWTGFRYPEFIMKHDEKFFLGIYGAGIGAAALLVLFRELLWRVGAVNAPRRIYQAMVEAVLKAPMSFYDVTPVGRIINRFTKDSEQLDFTVPMAANQTLSLMFTQLASMVAMCVILPYFTPIVAVVMLALFFVQPSVATVVLRRLSSSTAGPVAALYSEALAGSVSIRTIGLTEFFGKRFAQRVDESNAAKFADMLLFECIRARINLISAVLNASMMLIIMAMRDSLKAYDASFLVSNGMQVTLYMGYMMFQRGNLMLSLNSIERLNEYCSLKPEVDGKTPPPADWPHDGTVELENLTAQYRPKLPNVLNNVSVTFKSGEKIGVCGRTGSGKSSLLLTLFRLVPILGNSKVIISGLDTATMPLSELRSKVSAIPQEPVLFSGTVGENLDPFGTVDKQQLRDAIRLCHLEEPLEKLRSSKSTEKAPITDVLDVTVGDTDLSVGQKQLLCLARAVSRNLKILVLDEATSSVDVHTDQLIQHTIRTVFKDCTVITVAHRLNTIMDSDRVLVLDAGKVAEFEKPAVLLDNPDSLFANLVQEAAMHEEDGSSPMS